MALISQDKYITNTITEYLSKEFNIKIHKTYLNFLFDLVWNYFGIDLKNKITLFS
jgi:hypothetical protein